MRNASASAPGLLARLPALPRRVALLRASRIGDFLCAVPAFRALRQALPAARITLITLPMLRTLAERLPQVDEFAPFPGYPGIAEQLFEARAATRFFDRMQARRFDLAIQLQGSGVNSNPFLLMLGARHTAGFVRPGESSGRLDAALTLPTSGHEIHRVLALAVFLGALPRGDEVEFPISDAEHARAAALLAHLPGPLIGLHPPANHPARRWPLERFLATARALQARVGGTSILLGSAQEHGYARAMTRTLGRRCHDLTGRTALGTLGAVLARLTLLISSDSGPAHMAYAMRTPTVTVFRRGGRERYGPLASGPFRPLEPDDADEDCVTVAQVVQAATELMERHEHREVSWNSARSISGR